MLNPIQRIVVGVGSVSPPDAVLRRAGELARRVGAALHVVHAFNFDEAMDDAYQLLRFDRGDPAVEYARATRDRLAVQAEQLAGSTVTCRVEEGDPAEVLRRAARRVEADILVVGGTRRGWVGQRLLGSTAERVVSQAPLPVLLLRRPVVAEGARVLFASDLSEASETVHDAGMELVAAMRAEEPAQIRTVLAVPYNRLMPPPLELGRLRDVAKLELDRFLAGRAAPQDPTTASVRLGSPGEEIVREAAEWRADLIVLGTHRNRGLHRVVLGSVASEAIRSTLCNVLLIPPDRAPAGYGPGGAHQIAWTTARS